MKIGEKKMWLCCFSIYEFISSLSDQYNIFNKMFNNVIDKFTVIFLCLCNINARDRNQ